MWGTQGSVLGPLLFLVYVNDIYKAIPNTDIRLFADDTNVFVNGKNLDSVAAEANAVLLKLNNWFLAKKLSFSIDKTCFSVSGCKNVDTDTVYLNINNHCLNVCDLVNILV